MNRFAKRLFFIVALVVGLDMAVLWYFNRVDDLAPPVLRTLRNKPGVFSCGVSQRGTSRFEANKNGCVREVIRFP